MSVMNEPTIRPERLVRLRKLCLGLPGTEEKVAWGDPTWRVPGGRMFAGQKGNVEGHRPSLWLAAPDGAQSFLVGGDPERFFVPPYVGKQGWVGIWMDTPRVDWQMVEELIAQAYGHVVAATPSRKKAAGKKPTKKKTAKK